METYLRSLRVIHPVTSPTAFLIEYGKPGKFSGKPLPKGVRRGRLGYCYATAGRNAFDYSNGSRFEYVEGLAQSEGLPPLNHAWLHDNETGEVVDPTWPDKTVEYFGVRFSRDFLARVILETGVWGVIESRPFHRLCRTLPHNELAQLIKSDGHTLKSRLDIPTAAAAHA